jgi:DNA-3-methyladenine glycosylase II
MPAWRNRTSFRLDYLGRFCNACEVTTTRTGKDATKEQRAASEYLGSLDDSLAPWVQSTGPIDAYEMHFPVKVRGPLEWFSFAIASRQLSRAAAVAIYNRLVARLGGSITAERIIATDERTMRGVGLSHPKAKAIRGVAELADDGLLEPDRLAAMSDAEIQAELVAVPGIGPSSAQMFMIRCLHRPDIFPAGDFGVRAAVTALDGLDKRITPKAVEQRSELWRPYRSYATSYLWGYIWELHHPAAG